MNVLANDCIFIVGLTNDRPNERPNAFASVTPHSHPRRSKIPLDAPAVEPPAEAMSRLDVDFCVDERARWRSIDALLLRRGRFTGPDFEPGEDVARVLREHVRVLVVGAGGLGCELLKGLGA
jgi:hypothetical protein